MSSRSGSDSESNRSGSPISHGPAPTPGHGLEVRSASNSPHFEKNPSREGSRRSSRSGSRASSAHSRSHSAESRKSGGSHRSRSGSSHRSRSGSRRSSSGGSKRSRSGTPASNRSRSGSNHSGSNRSRSGSPASNRSNRSKSAESNVSHHSRSRSRSPSRDKRDKSDERSKSGSPNLQIADEGSLHSEKGDKKSVEGSPERPEKKKSRLIDTDSEEEPEPPKKEEKDEVSAAAIFGDADDISSEDERQDKDDSDREQNRSDDEGRRSDREDNQREADLEEEKENEPEPIPETRIDVEIPKISCDLGRDIHFVKLPNFLSVETRPFDPETYEDEIDEEETLDEEGRARLKLKVENTIRWKDVVDKEGTVTKESNARLVRWSDGSYSLHLGSEIFDVYKQPLQGDHNHLFIRQGTGLQGQAVFRTKLSFRPHSTESFTHRKMTLSLADRSQKTSGIKILSQVGADPDQDRKFLLKKEEEKLRQTVRVSKPRRKGDSGARSHNSSVYREEDASDEEGTISLNAIKNKYKSGSGAAAAAKGGAIYSSDEEGSDIEDRRARKQDKAKMLKDSESSEESE